MHTSFHICHFRSPSHHSYLLRLNNRTERLLKIAIRNINKTQKYNNKGTYVHYFKTLRQKNNRGLTWILNCFASPTVFNCVLLLVGRGARDPSRVKLGLKTPLKKSAHRNFAREILNLCLRHQPTFKNCNFFTWIVPTEWM